MAVWRRRPATQKLLPVVSAGEGHLAMADGSLRAVLQCPTLAFALKGEVERRAVTAGWSALLNALTHPIQVLVSTRTAETVAPLSVPTEPESARDRLAAAQGELLAKLSDQRRLLDRRVFLVVPTAAQGPRRSFLGGFRQAPAPLSTAGGEDAVGLLDQRAAWVADALRRIDLNPTLLGGEELTGLFYRLMCDRSAATQPLAHEVPSNWPNAVAPAATRESPAEVRLGARLARTLAVTAYPQLMRPSWLDVLLGFDGDLDVSLHISPASTRAMVTSLERQIAQLASTVRIAEEDGRRGDPYRRAALADAQDLQDRLARGEERLFDMAMYLTVFADSREALEVQTRRVEALLGSVMVNSRWLLFRMEPGLIASLPLGVDRVGVRRCLPTSVLAATFPFSGNDLTASSGLLYGINPQARSAVVLDRFRLPNHNAVVFGISGAGKSFAIKLEILRAMLAGVRVVVIDPESEYGGVVGALGGEVVSVRPGAPCGLDPFALPTTEPGALSARIASLLTLVELLAGGVSANQRGAAEEALSFAYASRGYSDDDPASGQTPPTLADVHAALTRRADRWTPQVRAEVEELAARLLRYVSGAGAWLLNHATTASAGGAGSIVYDVKGLPEEDRAAAMFMILDRVWGQLDGTTPTLVVIDESWRLMQHDDSARYVQRLAKTARKRLAGLTLVTQDVADVLSSPVGATVVTNSAVQVLMKQSPQAMPQLVSTFGLTEAEQAWLLNAQRGEGLILAMGRRLPFASVASEEEARVIEAAA